MIRFVLALSLLTVPIASPVLAQTALIEPIGERPGQWISLPRDTAPADVMEAPTAAPLILTVPAPSVVLTAPDAAPLIVAPRPVPDVRPTPRPRVEEEVEIAEVEAAAPEFASEVAAILAEVMQDAAAAGLEPDPVVDAAIVPAADPVAAEVAEAPLVPEESVVEDAPVAEVATAAPVVDPLPAPEVPATDVVEAAALAQALAVQIAVQARDIVLSGSRDIPQSSPHIGEVFSVETPSPAARAVLDALTMDADQIRPLSAPAPMFSVAMSVAAPQVAPVPMSAVFLPDEAGFPVFAVPARVAATPTRERAPILPNLRPSGPATLDRITSLALATPSRSSGVLQPSAPQAVAPMRNVTFAAMPGADMFPYSALPPSALPNGPDALTRTILPRAPLPAVTSAAQITGPDTAPLRLLPIIAPARPLVDAVPRDPAAPRALPIPDAGAIARLIEDAAICWRMTELPVDAQWAEVSVDVALDEWNMPSAPSITLTGFARVASGAAEDAYRAAHAALIGCAIASEHAPATSAATLLFDRNGVHLR